MKRIGSTDVVDFIYGLRITIYDLEGDGNIESKGFLKRDNAGLLHTLSIVIYHMSTEK